jgi:hypothetical protein
MPTQTVYSRALAREYREILAEPQTARQIMEKYDIKYPTVIKQLNSLIAQGLVIKDPQRTSNREFVYRLKNSSAVPVVFWRGQYHRLDKLMASLAPSVQTRMDNPINYPPGLIKDLMDFSHKFMEFVYNSMKAASIGDEIDRDDFRKFLLDTTVGLDLVKDTMTAILQHPTLWTAEEVGKWASLGVGEKFSAVAFKKLEETMNASYKKELARLSGK